MKNSAGHCKSIKVKAEKCRTVQGIKSTMHYSEGQGRTVKNKAGQCDKVHGVARQCCTEIKHRTMMDSAGQITKFRKVQGVEGQSKKSAITRETGKNNAGQ
jgi:hypothetical protein